MGQHNRPSHAAGRRCPSTSTPSSRQPGIWATAPADLSATLYDVLADGVDIATALRGVSGFGVDLIGGDRRLAELELSLVGEAMRERFLVAALEAVAEQYDFCVLDCPPNLGLLTVDAFVAADRLLLPVRMDEGALQGLIELRGTLSKLSQRGLHREIDGVLRTVVDPRRQVFAVLNNGLRAEQLRTLDVMIPARASFHRQGVDGAPIVISQPDSPSVRTYRQVADELNARLPRNAA